MKHRKTVVLVAVFVTAIVASAGLGTAAAQEPGSESFNETFDKDVFDTFESVSETSDGGYVLAGNTGKLTPGSDDALLIKTDENGNTEIEKTYGGSNVDQVRSVTETADGGYALAGRTESFASDGFDAWLIKTDSDGNEQFDKTFDREDGDELNSVVQTSDGGYALAGTTQSLGSGVGDGWLIKTDSNGNKKFGRTYGGSGFEVWESITKTSDGGYALAGRTESFGSGDSDAWLVKTDASGTVQFNKTYGGTDFEAAESVVQTADNGYAFGGETRSFGSGISDAWLVKTDASGTEQFSETYGGADVDGARSVAETSEGYVLAGSTKSYGSGDFDAWLVETDESGTERFNQTYGGSDEDIAYSVVETSEGGYALGGYTFSFGPVFDSDAWLVETVGTTENAPPSASFSYSPTNPGTVEVVDFDASGSSDPDGSIQSYEWDFGDGTTGSGEVTTYSYSNPDTYTVTLTVTDDEGATDTTTETITVESDGDGGTGSPVEDVSDALWTAVTQDDGEDGLSLADLGNAIQQYQANPGNAEVGGVGIGLSQLGSLIQYYQNEAA